MNYSLARFAPKIQDSETLTQKIQETARDFAFSSSLSAIIKNKVAQSRSNERAKQAVRYVIEGLRTPEVPAKKPSFELLTRIATSVGRNIVKQIIKPVISFAIRMSMQLVRIALQSVVRYAIMPAIELLVGFALANPVTAGIAIALTVAGGGYWIWKSFFKDEVTKEASTVAANDAGVYLPEQSSTLAAPVDAPPESVTQIVPTNTAPIPATQRTPTVAQRPRSLLDYITPSRPTRRSSSFEGFGADIDSYIHEASIMFNMDEAVLRGFIKMEAGWTGQMSPTGAIGTGQFTLRTWDSLSRTNDGRMIGMTIIGNRFRTPEDPRRSKRINTLATALLARDNANILRRNNIPITGENLYMMHNIGPGIIPVMQGREPNAATLTAMRQNGMRSGMTASEFLTYQRGRFNTQYELANTETRTVNPDRAAPVESRVLARPASISTSVANMVATNSSQSTSSPDRNIVRGAGRTLVEINNVQ